MKKIGTKLKKVSLELTLFLAIGAVFNVLFSAIGSYSFFTKEAPTQVQVKAASVQDILEKFEIKSDENGNAQSILLRRAESTPFSPIIYFSIEGELSGYILHINPVKLEEYKDYEIKINAIGDENKLVGNKSDILKGRITAKCINEFISEPREIQMTKGYVLGDRVSDGVQSKGTGIQARRQSLKSESAENKVVQTENSKSEQIKEPESEEVKDEDKTEESLNIERNGLTEGSNKEENSSIEGDIDKQATSIGEIPDETKNENDLKPTISS